MTAHAMQGDRERCIKAGMNDYIAKPVSPQALAEVLDRWLPRKDAECRKKEEKINAPDSFSSQITCSSPLTHRPSLLIFDRAGMMARLMDDDNLVRVVTKGFLEDIPRRIAALKGYLETGDLSGAERQAHAIKGASANVGGERLRDVAFEMEKATRAGDLSATGRLKAEMDAQFDLLNQAMIKEGSSYDMMMEMWM
jgi:HPt (histidine-containing phosphotransfer) domain-containing protein